MRMLRATANSSVHFLGSVFHKKRKTHISWMDSDSLIVSPIKFIIVGWSDSFDSSANSMFVR